MVDDEQAVQVTLVSLQALCEVTARQSQPFDNRMTTTARHIRKVRSPRTGRWERWNTWKRNRCTRSLLPLRLRPPPTKLLARCSSSTPGQLTAVVGLFSKTLIADGSLVGGFHVFDTATAAHDYVGGDLFATVRCNPAFSAFEFRRFDILDDLSAITNMASPPARVE